MSEGDGDAGVANRWRTANRAPFPILPDPRLELAKGYGATNSAFVALIDPLGQIDELVFRPCLAFPALLGNRRHIGGDIVINLLIADALIRNDPELKDKIDCMSGTLEVFAMMQFPNNPTYTRPVRLIGIGKRLRHRGQVDGPPPVLHGQ